MGGKILEFSADKYYNAGKADGLLIGEAHGEQKFAKLTCILLTNGKMKELLIAVNDKEYAII